MYHFIFTIKQFFKKLFYFFINTNLFIASAAAALTIQTQLQLGMAPQFHPYLFLIFFATLFDYNLHRLVTIVTNNEALNSDKHKWVLKNKTLFYWLILISIAGFLLALAYADKKVLLTLAPIALLTIFYSLPIFKNKKSIFRLREIPCLKIFIISFVWSAATIFLPIIQSGRYHNQENIMAMLAERFLFVFAITIPFDIRDMMADKQEGLKTIPLLIGRKNAILLSNIVLFIFVLVCLFHYSNTPMRWLNIAFILSAATTFIFINSKKLQVKYFYHYGILDGTMLCQAGFALICYYLKNTFY